MTARPRILVLGTLDTKGDEFAFLRDQLRSADCEPIVVDLGVLGEPAFAADIPREHVVERAGRSLPELATGRLRGAAMEAAIAGGGAIVRDLLADGRIDGVIAMGGGSGTTISTTIMEALPFGFPKLVVTTLSHLRPHVHGTDVVVVRTLVDLVGLNTITRVHIRQAAWAIAGMARAGRPEAAATPSVVITCLGVTTPGAMAIRGRLLAAGRDVIVLHYESHELKTLIAAGAVQAVIDLTPNEMTRGMLYPQGPDDDARLREVRDAGIPLVVVPGGLDMTLHFVPAEDRPAQLADRQYVVHSRDCTLIQTTADERARMGRVIGRQLASAHGPAAAVLPMRGFSYWDVAGRPFDDPAARHAFATALVEAAPQLSIARVDAAINDEEFADAVVGALLHLEEGNQQ